MLLTAVALAVVLLVWQRSIRRSGTWALVVGTDSLVVEGADERRVVRRADVAGLRWKRRRTRGAAWWELQLLGPRRRVLARESIADAHRPEVEAALAANGWPT